MRTLLVDGTNNFVRNYAALRTLNANGNPFGGVSGFLKSLAHFIRITKANRCVVVFDGEGGSKKRQRISEGTYKKHRRPNREIELSDLEEKINKAHQWSRLHEYLSYLPVSIVEVNNIEADDVIAYLCSHFEDDSKIIVSTDNDFNQLLSERVILYKPIKKVIYGVTQQLEEYAIQPYNFALARAIVGDKSDNIPGIQGIGHPTLLKIFPAFKGADRLAVDDLRTLDYDEKHAKFVERIRQNMDVIRRNYKLMQLSESIISLASIQAIKRSLSSKPLLNKSGFRVLQLKDGLSDISDSFFSSFMMLQ